MVSISLPSAKELLFFINNDKSILRAVWSGVGQKFSFSGLNDSLPRSNTSLNKFDFSAVSEEDWIRSRSCELEPFLFSVIFEESDSLFFVSSSRLSADSLSIEDGDWATKGAVALGERARVVETGASSGLISSSFRNSTLFNSTVVVRASTAVLLSGKRRKLEGESGNESSVTLAIEETESHFRGTAS